MPPTIQKVSVFTKGVHNKLNDEVIPQDAASESLNWNTNNGEIELIHGKQTIGGSGAAGKNYAEHTGFKVDGTEVRFRKVNGTIQAKYLLDTSWTDVITGLTVNADYTCSNYQSNAGAAVYFFGIDGIYKVMTADPFSFTSLYDPLKNHKGYGFIDKSSSFMWNVSSDKASLYRSYVDEQIYSTVSAEAIGSSGSLNYPGTLAFKAGGATRTAFGLVVRATVASGTETFTDNNNGVLTSNLGGTGTVNYTTGAYNLTFNSATTGNVTADYSYEDSNNNGVTDFTQSTPRLAGEGLVIPQKNQIISVIPLAGSYFSLQSFSSYKVTIDADDLGYTNGIFRSDIGVQSLRSAVGTGQGIIFINTANPSRPMMQKLTQNPLGDNFDVKPLFPQFAFENYLYDDALLDTWDQFIILGCKQHSSDENDRLLLCNVLNNTVDVTYYGIRTSTKVRGTLNGGDPLSQTTYELFSGFDDNGIKIENFWNSKGETYGNDVLKKVRKMRFKGKIDPDQIIEVYVAPDDGDFQLVGTILGSGDYVDYTSSFAIGTVVIGGGIIGGGDTVNVYGFYMEIKVNIPKFRKRKLKFVAKGFGFCSIEQITDFDIWSYEDKMPSKYRSKQNVSLDGETNQP